IFVAIFTMLISVALEGIFAKYRLPFLSIPFLIAIWTFYLASKEFTYLGISQRGIYYLNDLYNLGGQKLVDAYNWVNNFNLPQSIKTYFISLSAIFFQYNILTGFLISIGLLIYSRISFILSLLGFYAAFFFYIMIGSDITQATYLYIGFNFILTAIAIGGFFIVPSKTSYLSSILIIPLVVILTVSLSIIFLKYGLSVYSLPFNIIVILFIYVLKLRINKRNFLTEVDIQEGSPEKNLYAYKNNIKRFGNLYKYFPIKLPFWGEWYISQGHNDKITHKDEWQHAWDFVIIDNNNSQYINEGKNVEDYYCYNKPIIAPANGIVVDIVDGIDDNKIGDVNLIENWGNSIVIKHNEFLFSQVSHIKAGSFKVAVGDVVKHGDILANVGNTGRSPFPHMHFQIQATPYIGSKTIDYPISSYVVYENKKPKIISFDKPKVNQKIISINKNSLLSEAFNFVPGKILKYKVSSNNNIENVKWEVFTDIYNNSYIYCKKTKSAAYFVNNGDIFYFTKFIGSKKSMLYLFSLSVYRINFGFIEQLQENDFIQINNVFPKSIMFLQDIIAPFYMFLTAKYKLKYLSITKDFTQNQIKLESTITTSIFNNEKQKLNNKIIITNKGLKEIIVKSKTNNTIIFEKES
ncbi:MAG: peptidase M23, partial [Bacteroidetes bacterium]